MASEPQARPQRQRAAHQLDERLFHGRNVPNDSNLLYEGDPVRGIPAALYRYGNCGVSRVFGMKGNF